MSALEIEASALWKSVSKENSVIQYKSCGLKTLFCTYTWKNLLIGKANKMKDKLRIMCFKIMKKAEHS